MNSMKLLTHRVLQILVIPNENLQFQVGRNVVFSFLLFEFHFVDRIQVYKLSVKIISCYILSHGTLAEEFYRTVFQPLSSIVHDPTNFFNNHQGNELIRRSFLDYTSLLTELIELMRMENNKIRQNLFVSIQPLILQLNQFLPLIINRDPGRISSKYRFYLIIKSIFVFRL